MSGQRPVPNFGYVENSVVQEFYWDEDVEQSLREAIVEQTGNELVDGEYGDMVDGALVWWRSDDGEVEDMADLMVDAAANLENGGLIWLMIPKAGHEGHVSPADVSEAAKIAGLSVTSGTALEGAWSGFRLIARKRG
ncbi:DUF3052 domain-containing protein [Actinomycetaceae bacterium TAE3-ERU4]|nr:DUF3052 domain-containing protein [Actinomycetaceae bacterium TAE3-ERU4]